MISLYKFVPSYLNSQKPCNLRNLFQKLPKNVKNYQNLSISHKFTPINIKKSQKINVLYHSSVSFGESI